MADNIKMAFNVYAAVEQALFGADRLSKSEFGCLMQPGMFLSSQIQETDSSDDMKVQFELTNDRIDTSFNYLPLLGTLSQAYSDSLEFAALPKKPLPPEVLKELADLADWRAKNQNLYEFYRDRYFYAQEAYDAEASSQHPRGAILRRLQQLVDDSLNNWNVFGQKQLYETKTARYVYLLAGDPGSLWNDFRVRLARYKKTAPRRGDYFATFLYPAVSDWNSPNVSWTSYEKQINESDIYNYSKVTSWSAGASFGYGLFSIGGGVSGSKTVTHDHSEASALHVKFDYLRVKILRPWLVDDWFGYRFWTWKKGGHGFERFSDGGNLTITPPTRPLGTMPVLSKYFIVARNVELSSSFSEYDRKYVDSVLSGSANVGYGPFSFNGSYSEHETEQTVHASFDGTTIRIAQPQIIGVLGTLLPTSPNPDRTLAWQGDQDFGDGKTAPSAEEIDATRLADYGIDTARDYYLGEAPGLARLQSIASASAQDVGHSRANELVARLKQFNRQGK